MRPTAEAGAQRWKLAAALGVTLLIAYYDRMNISFAIPLIAKEHGWSVEETESYGARLISLFYVGYGFANIFLSPIAARFGPRRSLLAIVALWSLFTALGAWVSQFLMLLLASRVLLGLAEGVHFPMMNQLTKRWFPPEERSRANSLWISGLFIAVLTAPIVLVPIMDRFGWRTGFFVLAVGGLLISLPLVFWQIFDSPQLHPRASAAERAWLLERATQENESNGGDALWPLLRRPVFLLLLAAGMLNNVVALGIAGWLPTYLSRLDGVAYGDLSYLASLPYATSLLGLVVWSRLGDRTSRRGYIAAAGYAACGVFLWFALTSDSLTQTLVCLGLGTFAVSTFNTCEFAMAQRILPERSVATAAGIYNGLSTMVGGGLGPFIVGGVISGTGDPAAVAPIVAICLVTAAALALLGRATRY